MTTEDVTRSAIASHGAQAAAMLEDALALVKDAGRRLDDARDLTDRLPRDGAGHMTRLAAVRAVGNVHAARAGLVAAIDRAERIAGQDHRRPVEDDRP